MSILVTYITLVVVYLIACILDAPDIKKAWVVSRGDKYKFVFLEKSKPDMMTHIILRRNRFKASEDPGEIKDKIYILPYICFYFNTSTWYVSFGWLVFTFECWHKNWKKYDELIRRRVGHGVR